MRMNVSIRVIIFTVNEKVRIWVTIHADYLMIDLLLVEANNTDLFVNQSLFLYLTNIAIE